MAEDTPTPQVETGKPVETPEPEGKEYVEFRDPKEEARFKRVYRNMKEYERGLQELAAHNAQLHQTLEEIKAQGFQIQKQAEIDSVQQDIIRATEKGDTRTAVAAQTKLAGLQAEAVQQQQPVQVPQVQVPSVERNLIEDWKWEAGDDGNFRRPWAHERHPKYREAYELTRQIALDPQYKGDVQAILSAVDQKMSTGKKPNPTTATVLAGTPRRQSSKSEPTPDQKLAAQRMGVPLERYMAQVEAINSEKRRTA